MCLHQKLRWCSLTTVVFMKLFEKHSFNIYVTFHCKDVMATVTSWRRFGQAIHALYTLNGLLKHFYLNAMYSDRGLSILTGLYFATWATEQMEYLSKCSNPVTVDIPEWDTTVWGGWDYNQSLVALTDLQCVDHVLVWLELSAQG